MMTLVNVLPLPVLLIALWFGPLPIVVRGFIRGTVGPRYVHRWFRPVGLGFASGVIAAAVGVAVLMPDQVHSVGLLVLLFLLASIDWQWRWLPIEWTLGVAALAVIHGMTSGELTSVLTQMLVPALTLAVFRLLISWMLGKEALGMGDVWLLFGLGGFLQVFETFLLVGLAALFGLVEVLIRRSISADQRESTGVSYGTHLCIVFVFFRFFHQIPGS